MEDRRRYWTGITAVGDSSFGDSGKGKITDQAAQFTNITIRVGGGANAGHTVENEFGKFKFHLIPSGIFNSNNINYLASGVLVDPIRLSEEITELRNKNIEVTHRNLRISQDAHGVFIWHKEIDRIQEENRGKNKIGTTKQGIGPAAMQRAGRSGLRMSDIALSEKSFRKKFDKEFNEQERIINFLQQDKIHYENKSVSENNYLDKEKIWESILEAREILRPMIRNVNQEIWEAQDRGENILLELSQGALLDPIFGGYPFVTPTHMGIGGATVYTGIQGQDIHKAIGVTKAYSTRVGEGPMPTELFDGIGDKIREIGKEYGATTGRPRRVGWPDVPSIKYGMRIGGFDRIALTKSDVLDNVENILVCIGYEVDGKEFTDQTMSPDLLKKAVPIYKKFKGWMKKTGDIRSFQDLPIENQEFVLFLQKTIGKPIDIVSVGPQREQIIYKAVK